MDIRLVDKIECQQCGVCCTVFDISSLGKKEGIPCKFLAPDNGCNNYEARPQVCRGYKPDEICILISTLNSADKIKIVQKIYGL